MNLNCPNCGSPNRHTSKFCVRCGAELTQPITNASPPAVNHGVDTYVNQVKPFLVRFWRQSKAEFAAWYHDLITRTPEIEGQITTRPTDVIINRTVQALIIVSPLNSQSTQLGGLSFEVSPISGGPNRTLILVGVSKGEIPQVGDRIRAWGVWHHDVGFLQTWRLEVWERNGQPANYLTTTSRPIPLAALGVGSLGLMLLSLLCNLLGG